MISRRYLLGKGIEKHLDKVILIGDKAGKELTLETQLGKMKKEWAPLCFNCAETYRDTETYILKGVDEVRGWHVHEVRDRLNLCLVKGVDEVRNESMYIRLHNRKYLGFGHSGRAHSPLRSHDVLALQQALPRGDRSVEQQADVNEWVSRALAEGPEVLDVPAANFRQC